MKTHISRVLRKNQTLHERKLWYCLKNRELQNLKFRRQYKIGIYIVDFCCPAKRLVIELDGGHHAEDKYIIEDKKRQKYIENQDYKVLRFWNNDIDNNLDGVIEEILRSCSFDRLEESNCP